MRIRDPEYGQRYNGVEVFVEFVFEDDFVGHGDSEGFHGVCEGVVVGAYHLVEVVDHIFFRGHYFILQRSPSNQQLCLLISQTYINMDQDQFNDFQESVPAQDPPLPENTEESAAVVEPSSSVEVATESTLPEISMQPSISMITNSSTEKNYELESSEWEASSWPHLGKMESDHLVTNEPMFVNFSKRNSQKEAGGQLPDYSKGLLLGGEAKATSGNISNVATLNSLQFQDFDFGTGPIKPVEGMESSYDIRSQKNEIGALDVGANSEGAKENGQISLDKKAEVQIVNDEKEDFDGIHEAETEVRKESDEFVYQETTHPIQILEENVVNQAPLSHQPVNQMVNGFTYESMENVVKQEQNHLVVQQQSFQPALVNQTGEVTTKEVKKQEEKAQNQQEDDQFGEFEETAQTNEVEPQVEAKPSYQLTASSSNTVKIEPQKTPYGVDIDQKQKELQAFVDALPDYSFLLAEGFNSL